MSEQQELPLETTLPTVKTTSYIMQIMLLVFMLVLVVGLWWVFIKPQQASDHNTELALQHQLDALSDQQNQIKTTLTQVQAQLGTSAQAWVLSEAHYYLSSAQLRLSAFNDVTTALTLMQAVQQKLEHATVNADLQHALSADIAVLQAVTLPDLVNITQTLTRLDAQIAGLPLAQNVQAEQVDEILPSDAPENTLTWQQAASNAWQELKSLIKVQHRNETAMPDFTLGNEILLRQTVRVELQRASIAAVLGQSDLYQASLIQAQQALTNFFAAPTPEVESALDTLKTLMQQAIVPHIPPANQALLWLENNKSSAQG